MADRNACSRAPTSTRSVAKRHSSRAELERRPSVRGSVFAKTPWRVTNFDGETRRNRAVSLDNREPKVHSPLALVPREPTWADVREETMLMLMPMLMTKLELAYCAIVSALARRRR